MDSDLKFDSQIRVIVKSKLSQLAKIKPYLSRQHFETLIHPFVITRLDYCNALFVGVSESSVARLQMVQNAAAHLLTGTRKYEHFPHFSFTLLLPVHFRIQFKILLFVFKSLNGLAPPYISELLHPYMPTRSLRSTDQLFLNVPKTKRKLRGDRGAFAVSAPKLWNDLPLIIRQASSLPLFQSSLKTYLFYLAFDTWCWYLGIY